MSAQADPSGTPPRVAIATDDDQIAERLRWSPKERLDYLLDMLAFEESARRARLVSRDR
jgi:hypothetical protein